MMARLRGLLFILLFAPASALIVPMVALAGLFSRRALMWGAWFWAATWVAIARLTCGIRLAVRGAVPTGEVIVAMKHQSFYDAILTLYLFHRPVVVLKAGLTSIPFWGFVAKRHGVIAVDRSKGGSALRAMLREAQTRSMGRPVLIFPEGTRVAFGDAPPLKAGLSALYGALDRPVVPMTVDAGRLWTRGLAKHSGVITVAFTPDVPAGLPREAMEERVHAGINQDPRTCGIRS